MTPTILAPPETWAAQTFGSAMLGDRRRPRRLVRIAACLMRRPQASLPQQLRSWADLKACYRLLHQPDVTPAALLTPHWQQTRQAAGAAPLALLIQDTTQVDYTAHRHTTGLGPIGDGRGQGFLLQSVLAVMPVPRTVLGLAYAEPFLRRPAPPHETRAQRRHRETEAAAWPRAVAAIGAPPPGVQWVHVGDAYADMWAFLAACRTTGTSFLLRVAHDHVVTTATGEQTHLLPYARGLPRLDERSLTLAARHGQPARTLRLAVAAAPVSVPWPHARRQPPLAAWVVRAWEVDPPPEGSEPLEWVLLCGVETVGATAAWERVRWYRDRWLVEDFHMCLKTGCQLEARQLADGAALMRLSGLLAPIAVWLLALRELARQQPQQLARLALPEAVVTLVAALAEVDPATFTLGQFWQMVARLGGHLGRAGDGAPGWRTLWRGWQEVQTLCTGVRLAARLPPATCG